MKDFYGHDGLLYITITVQERQILSLPATLQQVKKEWHHDMISLTKSRISGWEAKCTGTGLEHFSQSLPECVLMPHCVPEEKCPWNLEKGNCYHSTELDGVSKGSQRAGRQRGGKLPNWHPKPPWAVSSEESYWRAKLDSKESYYTHPNKLYRWVVKWSCTQSNCFLM